MRSWIALPTALLAACGASLGNAPGESLGSDAQGNDSNAHDVAVQDAFPAWSAPQPIPGASTTGVNEDDVTLNSTLTELYFKKPVAGQSNDIFVMTRATAQDPWGPPVALAAVNTTAAEESPRLSYDDLTLFFGRSGDIYQTSRGMVGSPWSAPTVVPMVSTAVYEKWLAVCDGGLFMIARGTTAAGGDFNLFQGTLGVDAGTAVTELNSTSNEVSAFLSKDCLTTYFASNRNGTTDIFTSTRPTTTDPWADPTVVTAFSTDIYDEEDGWISEDQRTFVYASDALGDKDLYISTR